MSICKKIVSEIKAKEHKIKSHLRITEGQWSGERKSMLDSIEKINDDSLKDFKENYLTFIVACAYAVKGEDENTSLLKILSNQQLPPSSVNNSGPTWFQFSPHTCKDPQSGPGGKASSKLDLAFGNFTKYENSEIVYDPPEQGDGWICFVEMKILEDISSNSKDNPIYNQFAKYIKSAINFHEYSNTAEDKKYPANIHISLVTPKIFIENPGSRLYSYKFKEYKSETDETINVSNIKKDIPDIAKKEYFDDILCKNLWINSNINERLQNLKLHLIPYEDILDAIPESRLKECINEIRANNRIFDKPSGS